MTNIICTQPRRISAIGVAERVARYVSTVCVMCVKKGLLDWSDVTFLSFYTPQQRARRVDWRDGGLSDPPREDGRGGQHQAALLHDGYVWGLGVAGGMEKRERWEYVGEGRPTTEWRYIIFTHRRIAIPHTTPNRHPPSQIAAESDAEGRVPRHPRRGCVFEIVCVRGMWYMLLVAPPHTQPQRNTTVHERSLDSDFLLIILRDLLPRRPDLKASVWIGFLCWVFGEGKC